MVLMRSNGDQHSAFSLASVLSPVQWSSSASFLVASVLDTFVGAMYQYTRS